jgi:hypothetical protein
MYEKDTENKFWYPLLLPDLQYTNILYCEILQEFWNYFNFS